MSTPICAECKDSRLVIAASVITFLTFVYAVVAGIYIRYAVLAREASELPQLLETLTSSIEQFGFIDQRIRSYEEKVFDRTDGQYLIQKMRRGDDLTDDIASIREKMRPESPDRYFGRRVVKWKDFLWILGKKAELATLLKRHQETLRECQFLVMQLYVES